jgi:hypothetical protein
MDTERGATGQDALFLGCYAALSKGVVPDFFVVAEELVAGSTITRADWYSQLETLGA